MSKHDEATANRPSVSQMENRINLISDMDYSEVIGRNKNPASIVHRDIDFLLETCNSLLKERDLYKADAESMRLFFTEGIKTLNESKHGQALIKADFLEKQISQLTAPYDE